MTQIFVFVAGNPDAQRHLAATIESTIDEDMVFDSFPAAHREELEGILEEGNGFRAWGAVPGEMITPRWEAMERDDYVLNSYGSASVLRDKNKLRGGFLRFALVGYAALAVLFAARASK
jgi:hypothetical protein